MKTKITGRSEEAQEVDRHIFDQSRLETQIFDGDGVFRYAIANIRLLDDKEQINVRMGSVS